MTRLPTPEEARAHVRRIVTDALRPISLGILTQAPHRVYLPARGPGIADPDELRAAEEIICECEHPRRSHSRNGCGECSCPVTYMDLSPRAGGQGDLDPRSFADEFETRVAAARLEAAATDPDPEARAMALRAAVADGEIRRLPGSR